MQVALTLYTTVVTKHNILRNIKNSTLDSRGYSSVSHDRINSDFPPSPEKY
jgi:hypothetical protein